MDKMALLEAIEALIDGNGPVFARITTETQVIWAEVTGVQNVSDLDPPWQHSVLEIDTRPIPDGVGARMNRPDVFLLPGVIPLPGGLTLITPKPQLQPKFYRSEQGPEQMIEPEQMTITSPLHGRMYDDDAEAAIEALPDATIPAGTLHRNNMRPIVIPNISPEHDDAEDPAESHYGDVEP